MAVIELTPAEMFRAALVGVARHLRVMTHGQHKSPLLDGDVWGNHIEGAAGECAFAKYAGVYWDASEGTYDRYGDVAGLEVRTRRRKEYELLIRPGDHDKRRFVLVRGVCPSYDIVGWC